MLQLASMYPHKRVAPRNTDSSYWEVTNGSAGCVIYEYAGVPTLLSLHKISAAAYYEIHCYTNITGENPATGDVRIMEYNPDNTTLLTATNGGYLLGLANQYKDYFFDGQTQTAESLYAYMCEKYGEAYAFAYNTSQNPIISAVYMADVESKEYGFDQARASRLINFVIPDDTSISGVMYGSFFIPSAITSYNDAVTYMHAMLIFDPNVEPPTNKKLIFDVYVDGTKDPNVAIRWKYEGDDDISTQLVTPRIWTEPGIPSVLAIDTHEEDGIIVPNKTMVPTMREYTYTWPGSYTAPYINEFNVCTADQNAITKTILYGIDGIADKMGYLLRFNQQVNENNTGVMTWGTLYRVLIPREVESASDIGVVSFTDSENNPDFITEVHIHLGVPEDEIPDDDDDYPDGEDSTGQDPGTYDPDKPPHDFSTGESSGYPGKGVLTKTYAMTSAKTANVGSKLWSQSYFDVLKIQNNPIENIVSMKWFPFSVAGPSGEIVVGNVDFGLQTAVVDSIYKFTMGSCYYKAKNPSSPTFLDLSPYTTLKLHLPYCGIVQLDATEMLNRKLTVKYTVDLVSGDCMAFLYLDDNIPYMNISGHCGVDVPLTSSDRIQTELRAASTTISAVTGAAAHVISGDYLGAAADAVQGGLAVAGMDYTSQRTSAHSPACTSTANRGCYLEIWRPAFNVSEGFKSRHGYPCHKFKQLSSFSGFIKCDARTKIDFAMTARENEMLERLLTSGVYV